jgi:alkanesulfonate monooxygenase SsuD/methylene tetrahydromethanopterin reductase-like flavin-dependent oxidoreductase (luciferase family)
MQFGLFVPRGWQLDLVGIAAASHWPVIQSLASRTDRSGWTSVWVFDHFHTVPESLDEATHEAWTLMAAIAATAESVRLGQMRTCMGYRNPACLAKVGGQRGRHLGRPRGYGHRRWLVRPRMEGIRLRVSAGP